MATKVTIIGKINKKRNFKPIEFYKCWSTESEVSRVETEPKDYDFIELIAKDYFCNYDLMFAYDKDDRAGGTVFIGHFNDGVVE